MKTGDRHEEEIVSVFVIVQNKKKNTEKDMFENDLKRRSVLKSCQEPFFSKRNISGWIKTIFSLYPELPHYHVDYHKLQFVVLQWLTSTFFALNRANLAAPVSVKISASPAKMIQARRRTRGTWVMIRKTWSERSVSMTTLQKS